MADHIQIGDISPRIQYAGDGAQTVFTYPFPIFIDADIEVYEDTNLQTITTHYTVAGAGVSAGGTVTFVSAPASGVVVTLRRNIAIERTSDFQESGEFRAKVINDELDKLTATVQQIETEQDRALHLGPTDSVTSSVIPDKTSRLGKVLSFDAATGDPVVSNQSLATMEAGSTAAAASAAAALVSENAAAADTVQTAADAVSTAADVISSAASATAAAAAAASNLFSKVISKATANSPYSVVADTDDGTLFTLADDGVITLTLPSIATAGAGERYGFMRVGSSYAITLARDGTDTINGVAGNYIMASVAGEILVVVADDASPDNWIIIPWTQAAADESSLTKSGTILSVKALGITTAKIADDAVTLAKLAAGTDGELITWDASGDPAAVAVGAADQVLTSNGPGAAPTFQAPAGGGKLVNYSYTNFGIAAALATNSVIGYQDTPFTSSQGVAFSQEHTHTPLSTSNFLKVTFRGDAFVDVGGRGAMGLFYNSITNAIHVWEDRTVSAQRLMNYSFIFQAPIATAMTFKLRCGVNYSGMNLNLCTSPSAAQDWGGQDSFAWEVEEFAPL